MAAPSKSGRKATPVRKAWRSLAWLGIIIVGMFALNAAGVIWGGNSWAPKLALDLEGGTQVILAPKLESGATVSQEQLDQAVAIIRQRVDASGVSEAEINTQGQNVVVSIPGELDEETRNRVSSSAKLEFRPVLLADVPSAQTAAPSETPAEATPPAAPTATPTDGSDLAWITPELQTQFDTFDCAQVEANAATVAPADKPLITCESDGSVKYILGPVETSGANIKDATNGLTTTQTGATTGEWGVNIVFDAQGTKDFAAVTSRLAGLQGVQNQFAIVLDGSVISAPRTNAVITDGRPRITGNFTQESSKVLADQLKFGALPISFTLQSVDTISATLGSTQLQSGIIAGLIGLLLVVIYTLFQYRLLGFVTIASITVAAILTYMVVMFLSWREGYRLSLAGVAGLIVSIGFTADSFIIYFERVRDELRDGRGLVSAVEAGWKRAVRTVYAAKGTNLLAAVVLYVLAVGNVRGFALMLGITTIIDVLVVIIFTHPMLQLLANNKFFASGHPLTGLDPNALGAVYRGRAQFRTSTGLTDTKKSAVSKEAAKRQTIAERKAAELVSTSTTSKPSSTEGKNNS